MIITFDLFCHANLSLANDSDFHCRECCFISTSYPQIHGPSTHSNLFHKVLIHFSRSAQRFSQLSFYSSM